MAKDALPPRYVVDRKGAADPASSEYYVLDVVNDWIARENLARLGNRYRQAGKQQLADECFGLLDSTLAAHTAVMAARQPKKK